MTDQQFGSYTYDKIKETILRIDEAIVPNIYVLSFYVNNCVDDPRQPMLTVGYNTIERWRACTPARGQEPKWPIAFDTGEAKWNFAFWLQNEELVIGGHDYDPVSAWVKNSPYYYTDEEAKNDYDTTDLLGQKIQYKFVELAILNAQKLHTDKIITTKFRREIPIIIHELEYYDKTVSWTRRANPESQTREFEKWVNSL